MIHLFKDKAAADKITEAGKVFLSDTMTVNIDDERLQRLTLSQIATRLQKTVGLKNGAIGISLVNIQFALIADPAKVKQSEPQKLL